MAIMTVVILGGTAEARQLAAALIADGIEVVSSLAGRVRNPRLPAGPVRIGGFGGADGLAAYLRDHHVSALVDATHPFAVQITTNALQAASVTNTPLIRLERPGWSEHPLSGGWMWVADAASACVTADSASRPFLTTGRQSLPDFDSWAHRDVLVRLVDPPTSPVPQRWTVITSRGPYCYAGERQILDEYAVDALLTKDSGGSHTAAKLEAAADLGIPVIVIARPEHPPVPTVTTVAEVVAWCRSAR
jgi:precorrin-6A/cobalt-precorrin-6A reductase